MNRTGTPIPWRLALVALALAAVLLSGCSGPAPSPEVSEGPGQGLQVIEHKVLPGETLARIADNYYGDPGLAPGIARDNGLTDPGHVAEGSVLVLRFAPEQWENARRRAAALDAYNRGVDQLLAEAEKQFRLALETAPDLLAARYNLALVHLRRGHNDEALALLDELRRQRPGDRDFQFARGNALFQLTRFEEAAGQFAAILDQEPGHLRAAFSLARSLQAAGRDREALAAWGRYLELDSTSSWAETARRNYRKLSDDSGG
jgi:hypothetical protein